MPQENEKVMRQLHSDLTMMKTKIHNNSINKVIDFCLEKGQMNNDAENLYVITEAQQGIPIFEWILQSAGKDQLTENQAALIMREVFNALKVA